MVGLHGLIHHFTHNIPLLLAIKIVKIVTLHDVLF
jgi:hypothetical protein